MDNWVWALLLLILAIAVGFIELFVPSGGSLTVLAILALIGSLVFAFLHDTVFGAIFFIFVMVGVPFLIWYLLKIWQTTPFARRILLNPAENSALQPDETIEKYKTLIGKTGIAKSFMTPAGQIEIEGKCYDAMSEGMAIDPKTAIVVVHVDGVHIIVRVVKNFPERLSDIVQSTTTDERCE
ncbi:MAG: NfeD family protein [Planctomycetaceae bacterium]|jgi:membrane-bound serine protease (ClpP class)|nr:NfeD family protein [Planctomycetaceae bacterium]